MILTDTNSFQKQNETIVFTKTETDISAFFNYLKAGKSPEKFLEDHPQINLESILELLELAEETVKARLSA